MTSLSKVLLVILLLGVFVAAQEPPATPPPGGVQTGVPGGVTRGVPGQRMQGGMMQHGPGGFRGTPRAHMGGMPGGGLGMPGGKWWKSDVAQRIGLTDQQGQQIEKIFQDHRLQLVDLHANLEKQELQLEPLIQADNPNEQQVLAQIDKVAQARAALEKSNASMHLGIRRVLTAEQWQKLQSEHRQMRPMPRPMPGPMPMRERRPTAPPGDQE